MLTRFVIHILALLFVFYVVWHVHNGILIAAVLLAIILALINTIIRPVLVVLTLPVTVVTLGLFILVLNALLFALSFAVLQSLLHVHFDVSFGLIVLGYLIYVLVSWLLTELIRDRR